MSDHEDHQYIRCLSAEPCILHELTNAGFLPIEIRYKNGSGHFTGEVVGRDILRNLLEVAGDAIGVSVRNISRINTEGSTSAADDVDWQLTPAQQEALQTAYDAGYFEVPRKGSADVVADELNISKSAFIQRLRRAEKNYFHEMLDAN